MITTSSHHRLLTLKYVLDPRSDRALYRQLADTLRARIESGELAPGSQLPSEATLAQEYGVARPAVRNAIALLRSEGLVTTERGTRARVREELPREEIRLEPGDTVICRMPAESERNRLGMDPGVPVLIVSRAAGKTELYAGDRVKMLA